MSIGIQIIWILSAVLCLVPRRYAPLVLLGGGLFIPMGARFEIGSLHMFSYRLLIIAGIIRTILRGELPSEFLLSSDRWFLCFSLVCMISGFYHDDPYQAMIYRGSLILDAVGSYWLLRTWTKSWDDVLFSIKGLMVLFFAFSLPLIYEAVTGWNPFVYLGATREFSAVRDGNIRAQGPFAHAILAGTVGAVCFPLAIALWRENKPFAVIGAISILSISIASMSSGPLLSVASGIVALYLWKYRSKMRLIRWAIVCVLCLLELVMQDHVWWILAKIDIISSSTGWHRAKLISSAFDHLNEWWLAGTDYTRHWMLTGVSWSPDHIDITNHYLQIGIIGGIPLMIIFIMSLTSGFKSVGRGRAYQTVDQPSEIIAFQMWCLGASLFSHCMTMLSVSYFDQSMILLYSLLGLIASGCTTATINTPRQT